MAVNKAAHPSTETLQALALGKLANADAEPVLTHVKNCPDCYRIASSLSGDGFRDRLRDAHQQADTTPPDRTIPPRTVAHQPQGMTTTGPVGHSPSGNTQASWSPETFPAPFGRYRILELLGKGGMGAVYLAHDTQLDRPVALKIPHFEAADSIILERFYREARAAATVVHPNICPLHDIGEIGSTPYLTMTFIEGKPLAEVASNRPLTQQQSAILVRKLALALAEAHKRGIIHRDLKPANIMIDRRSEPIIMDFGLARRTASTDSRLTRLGAVLGTPAYMPPEQANGDLEKMGPASDIYSLGVIFYELLTGRRPFSGDPMSMLLQVLMDEPPPPSEVRKGIDPHLEAICLKAMAKKIEDRYESMAQLVAVLTDALRSKTPAHEEAPARETLGPVQAKTSTRPGPVPARPFTDLTEPAVAPRPKKTAAKPVAHAPLRKPPRWRMFIIAGTAAALLLLLGGIVLFWPTPAGTVRIEINDPDVKLTFDEDGATINGVGKTQITLKPGQHTIVVTRGDFTFTTDKFILKPGATVTLQIGFLDGRVQVVKDGEAFAEREVPLAKTFKNDPGKEPVLPPPAAITEVGLKTVMTRLKHLNRGFDGAETHVVDIAGVMTELAFVTDKVTDISPVQALTGLRTLTCSGSGGGKGQLVDLSPLKDLKLTSLSCYHNKVSDLTALKDMKLAYLDFSYTQVANLVPLKDMKLTQLHFGHTPVVYLLPLQNMPLTILSCPATKVDDLWPLRNMKLTFLDCSGTRIANLSPLKGMPLKELICNFKPKRDVPILRAIKTLETVNGKPARNLLK